VIQEIKALSLFIQKAFSLEFLNPWPRQASLGPVTPNQSTKSLGDDLHFKFYIIRFGWVCTSDPNIIFYLHRKKECTILKKEQPYFSGG
jgi:hypothetical protein